MRLLASTDFALRVLMRLACEPERRINSEQLAGELRISRNHLQKIVQNLANHGIVCTSRGVNGGISLSRAPSEILVGAVVRLFEDKHTIVECYHEEHGPCVLRPRCGLINVLVDARETFMQHLDQFTIADCIKPRCGRRQTKNA